MRSVKVIEQVVLREDHLRSHLSWAAMSSFEEFELHRVPDTRLDCG